MEYIGHLITADGISFTEEKRLKVLNFPKPTNEKQIQMFIGLANYFRDHVPNMTEMTKPLRDMFSPKTYKPSGKLVWTPDQSKAF